MSLLENPSQQKYNWHLHKIQAHKELSKSLIDTGLFSVSSPVQWINNFVSPKSGGAPCSA